MRWYKVSGDRSADFWVRHLLERKPPPLAIIGGGTSYWARELAIQLRNAPGKIKGGRAEAADAGDVRRDVCVNLRPFGGIAAAEERFHVRGLLAVSLLGGDAVVEMDEAQLFQVRITDQNPLSK